MSTALSNESPAAQVATNTTVRADAAPVDPELELLIPEGDIVDPEFSIVIPALNEQLTISDFIDWCREGLAKAGVQGEILIVDSSTDKTSEIALSKGARVLKSPKRGLGRAYIDSLPFIRGKYVLLGDCDCTYDFRELKPFVEKFHGGAEFIMGSRFRGYIEPGAMPPLHRYLGTPVTTWILNVIFSSHFSDIHCGMRGIRRDAFIRMGLRSQSWEYASEMVLKSVHMKLKTEEVPIRFLKDVEGRLSHHKRSGWFSPWAAAWINLRAMFVYGADFFLYRPGIVLAVLGFALTLPLSFGPLTLGPITFSLHWMLLGLTMATVGLQCIYMGVLAQTFFDYSGAITARWFKRFPYTRTVFLSAGMFTVGMGFTAALLAYYVRHQFLLAPDEAVNHLGVTGLLLMITGFMTFTFTLLLHSTAVAVWRRP
jgi:glycosyltransferase involved in cell wall biosynthesis